MKLLENLQERANILRRDIAALYYAYQSPDTGIHVKIIILFTLGYSLSPIDLIPDFIPVFGYLDDLIVIPAMIALSIRLIPKDVMDKCRTRAENEPVQLHKNFVFAAIFILIGIILLILILSSLIKIFNR